MVEVYSIIMGVVITVINLAWALYGYHKATVIRDTLSYFGGGSDSGSHHGQSQSKSQSQSPQSQSQSQSVSKAPREIPPYSEDCGLSKESYDIISKPEFYPNLTSMIWYGMTLAKLGVVNSVLSWFGLIPSAGIAFSIISALSSLVGLYLWIRMLIAPDDQKIVMKDIRRAVNGGKKIKLWNLVGDSLEMIVVDPARDELAGEGHVDSDDNLHRIGRYAAGAGIAKNAVAVAKPSKNNKSARRHRGRYLNSNSDSDSFLDDNKSVPGPGPAAAAGNQGSSGRYQSEESESDTSSSDNDTQSISESQAYNTAAEMQAAQAAAKVATERHKLFLGLHWFTFFLAFFNVLVLLLTADNSDSGNDDDNDFFLFLSFLFGVLGYCWTFFLSRILIWYELGHSANSVFIHTLLSMCTFFWSFREFVAKPQPELNRRDSDASWLAANAKEHMARLKNVFLIDAFLIETVLLVSSLIMIAGFLTPTAFLLMLLTVARIGWVVYTYCGCSNQSTLNNPQSSSTAAKPVATAGQPRRRHASKRQQQQQQQHSSTKSSRRSRSQTRKKKSKKKKQKRSRSTASGRRGAAASSAYSNYPNQHDGAPSDSDLNSFHGYGNHTTTVPSAPVESHASHGAPNCSNCGVAVHGKFCAECGMRRPKPAKRVCSGCGVRITGKFCAECGTNNTRAFLAMQQLRSSKGPVTATGSGEAGEL
jgi:hypothetical protein